MATKYRVVIRGLKPGESTNLVAIRLGTLFKLPPEKVVPVLSRPGTSIKSGIDLERAVKYQSALENAGCDCIVEPDVEVARFPEIPTVAHQPAATPTAAHSSSFELFKQKVSEHLSVTWRKKATWAVGTVLGGAFLAWTVSIIQSWPSGDGTSSQAAARTIVGSWTCQTQNPNGSVTQDTFHFQSNGGFEINSGGIKLNGVYENDGNGIVMTVRRISTGRTTMSSDRAMDANITTLNQTQLQLESVMRGSGNKRSSSCSRVATVTTSTPSARSIPSAISVAPPARSSISRPHAPASPTAPLQPTALAKVDFNSLREMTPSQYNDPNDTDWRSKSPTKFLTATADFDGNGSIDSARLLLTKDGRQLVLLVTMSGNRRLVLFKEKPSYAASRAIEVIEPEVVKTACGKGYWTCAGNEPANVVLKRPALISSISGLGATVLHYWNDSKRTFDSVALDD